MPVLHIGKINFLIFIPSNLIPNFDLSCGSLNKLLSSKLLRHLRIHTHSFIAETLSHLYVKFETLKQSPN